MRKIALLSLVGLLLALPAMAQSWTAQNPTRFNYDAEPLALKVKLDANAKTGQYIVEADGKQVPAFVDHYNGEPRLWVAATMPAKGSKINYKVSKGSPQKFPQAVKVTTEGKYIVVDNGITGFKVPVSQSGGEAPGPLAAVKLKSGQWIGKSFWKTDHKLKKLTTTIVGNGEAFARIRLEYEFDGKAGLHQHVDAYTTVTIDLAPSDNFIRITDDHEMKRGSFWEFEMTADWDAMKSESRSHSGGAGQGRDGYNPGHLKPLPEGEEAIENRPSNADPRIGLRLLNLFPRWNQHYQDGWAYAIHNDKEALGVMVARAGKWYWPHNNAIEIMAKRSGDYAGMRCSTWKGKRYWFVFATDVAGVKKMYTKYKDKKGNERTRSTNPMKPMASKFAYDSLNKINNEYILDWPGFKGKKLGGFAAQEYFTSGINPTGFWRSLGRQAIRGAGGKGNLSDLTGFQIMMHPDMYGSYWHYWSPENPNFYTDFIKRPIGIGAKLREHPQFDKIKKMVEQKLREDLYHSVTLPGGAGQECPGYQNHAGHAYKKISAITKKYYGFDMTTWPRYKAMGYFFAHSSFPQDGDRYMHPGGDTHPAKGSNGRPGAMGTAKEYGYSSDVKKWKTEELPGFGVIMRNNPGTGKETYLAFKSGPNRGHYHGDQLSLHMCFNAKPTAVDHHASYAPRVGQEHMHNRVSFSNDKWKYTNMDGYERVIALKTGKEVDITVGQVESERIRKVRALPPEMWHQEYPRQTFETPLKYRRTIVMIKGNKDFFVIRDQYAGEKLNATYNLHVRGNKADQKGGTIAFEGMSFFVANHDKLKFERLDWSHTNGKEEKTKGVRFTQTGEAGEFITVLYPGAMPASVKAVAGGVVVDGYTVIFAEGISDDDAKTYVKVSKAGKAVASLSGKDIDMDRSQGEIGIFVPDAGYPFGEIPDWLSRQRSTVPDWAPDWAKKLRARDMKK